MIEKQIKNLLPQAILESVKRGELTQDSLHLLKQLSTKVAHEYLFKSDFEREEAIMSAVEVCKDKFRLVDETNYSGCYDFFYNFVKGDIQKNWRKTLKGDKNIFKSRQDIIKGLSD